MTFNINRDILLKPLSAVASIVEKRHTLPILSNVLIEAKDQQLTLTATDLEMQISLSINTPIGAELSTTISAKKLLDICRALPDNTEINMTTTDSRVAVKAGKSKFNLQTLPAVDYPVMTKAVGTETVTIGIAQSTLKNLFKQVEFAMAQQEVRRCVEDVLPGLDALVSTLLAVPTVTAVVLLLVAPLLSVTVKTTL